MTSILKTYGFLIAIRIYYDFELTRIKYTCKFREININSHVPPRPGFVRLNLPYFMSDDSVEFVIKAVKMVAEHGWKLLSQVIKYFCKRSVFNGKDPNLSSRLALLWLVGRRGS